MQGKNFKENEEVLLIFNGPHAYVSSSWYDHENVPTWNYIAVHVYGKLKLINNDELLHSLNLLVDKYEANMNNPVRIQDFSDKTMKQLKGIIGFKVSITEIQAAYKLSQNRNERDHQEIIDQLKKSNNPIDHQVSEMMKKKE